jgi:1-acyl-sn-glycerol-3-phosphate acyltransferase
MEDSKPKRKPSPKRKPPPRTAAKPKAARAAKREPAAAAPAPEEIAREIEELEHRLDVIIGDHARAEEPSPADAPTPLPWPATTAPPPDSTTMASAADQATVFDTARDLLTTDFYLRRWGRMAMRNRSEDVDDFGYDPTYDKRVRPLFDFLYERWFRVECRGVGNVPGRGRCMLVANHSGTIPFDGPMLKTAVKREHAGGRDVRWLTEDFVFHFPFLGSFESRIGAVRACQENAERLLRQEGLVAVFPEGTKGIGKLFRDRYKLQRFGRGGFIRLALRTQTPIVPVAIVGAEETNPMLFRVESFSKLLNVPYVPVTPTFPLLGPLGLLPAPTKWKIVFGAPLELGSYGPESENDEMLVSRLAETVRQSIQELLDTAVRERKSVLFG